MRFNCTFEHRDTGERKTVPVALSAEEVRSVEAVRALGDYAVLFAEAYALSHAYREVPRGFLHTEPPQVAHLS
jgi:hypothetical protein